MQRHIDTCTYHNPEDCLQGACITLTEMGEQWEIDWRGSGELPVSICASGEHTHANWPEYRECYGKIREKLNCRRELHAIRGAKTHELCRKCIDIFADHAEAQCPIDPEQVNLSLLDLWENPTIGFVKLVGTMANRVRKIHKGPCPLCKANEEQHDYAMCLRMGKITREQGILNITTGQRQTKGSAPGPVLTGLTPGTTPQGAPKTPAGDQESSPQRRDRREEASW